MIKANALKSLGLFICLGYIILDPWMFQNTINPYFNGIFGKLQIVDIFIPFIFLYILIYLGSTSFHRNSSVLRINNYSIVAIVSILFLALFTGYINKDINFEYILNILKIGYLFSIYFVFSFYLSSNPNSLHRFILLLAFIFLLSAIVSFAGYLVAFSTGETNALAKVYEFFPYIERPTRMIGTFGPTSKVFGLYMLILSLIIFLYKDKLNSKLYLLVVSLILVCSVLTLSRVSIWILMFWSIIFLNNFNKENYLNLSIILGVLAVFILFQIITVFHFGDIVNPIISCNEEFIFEQNEYYGWLEYPHQCKISGELNYTYSSYFLMKVAAFNAWIDAPFFGNGLGSFEHIWIDFALNGHMPMYFTQYVFPLVQSTYLTIMVEQGVLSLVIWLCIFIYPIYVSKRQTIFQENSFIILIWTCFIFIVMFDLDIQNFRFTYYLFPIIHTLLGFSSLHTVNK